MSTHLKSEQFNDFLVGIAENETAAHLSVCPQCRTEIEALRRSLGLFRVAAFTWGEVVGKQVALPGPVSARPRSARPGWVLAAAILLAVAISFSVWRGWGSDVVATSDRQAQIARDNLLLANIQSEIGETTPVPLQPLQINH